MSHTEGKLTSRGDLVCDSSGNGLWDYHEKSQEENEANARRQAACWNACEGLETKDIEELLEITEGPLSAYISNTVKLVDERDELVKALRKVNSAAFFNEADWNEISFILAKYPEGEKP